jgi:Ca-activated chloride channel family protein
MSRRPHGSVWPAAAGLLVAAAALAPLTPVPSEAQQSGVFRGTAQTVPVFATVTGPDGRLVTDLELLDFELYDDGRLQPIEIFGNEPLPINIVVMLDTSGSMSGNLSLVRSAAVQLFTHLRGGDRARVGNFGDRITVSPRFTSDQNELIRWMWTDLQPGGPTPLWGAIDVGMTALAGLDGRRVVLVFTDGRDASSRQFVRFSDVVRRAEAEGFMIYGIGMWSHGARGSRRSRRSAPPDPGLKELAEETGGGYAELFDARELGPAFARVAEELRHQYLLGFSAAHADGKVHTLDVRLRRSGMTVRARKSYVAPTADSQH